MCCDFRGLHGAVTPSQLFSQMQAVALVKFIAHLVNQQVAHEVLALQVLSLLLAQPTADSVEIAISFVKECGQLLADVSPAGLNAVFERFRSILHGGGVDKRVLYMVEALFAVRKGGFEQFPRLLPELDLIEEGEQITHELGLTDAMDKEDALDVFRVDPKFKENEALWGRIRQEIIGDSDSDGDSDSGESDGSDSDSASGSDSGSAAQPPAAAAAAVGAGAAPDAVEAEPIDLAQLRRTIYLVMMSSLDFEECAHKLLGLRIPEEHAIEVCNMIVECCAQEKTYRKMFGLLGQRFCMLRGPYRELFEEVFARQFANVHSLETNKLRNVAKFFAHLLSTDALPWTVFEFVRLSEEDTTSSSRIFLKVLLQEVMGAVGMATLKTRLHDRSMRQVFEGMLPMADPRATRFAINFYTKIGLGALTDEMRHHLANAPALLAAQRARAAQLASDSSSDSGSDSDSSSGSYSSRSYSSRSYSSRSRSYSSRSRSYSSRSRSYSSRSRSRSPSRRRDRGSDRDRSPPPRSRRGRSASKERRMTARSPTPPPRAASTAAAAVYAAPPDRR